MKFYISTRSLFRGLFFMTLFFFSLGSYSQECDDCRYLSEQFDGVTYTEVPYGQGLDFNGDMIDLSMYYFQADDDTIVQNRPVMIYAFGGGFLGGHPLTGYVRKFCTDYAKAGYVAIAIDYRIDDISSYFSPTAIMQMFFRPMQDMRGAVQYVKGQAIEEGNPFRVDTNLIFVGGGSAGAITALMTTYCDKESEWAASVDPATTCDPLGGFYSTSAIDYTEYSYRVAGAVAFAGGLVNADWVEPGDPPCWLVHGDLDPVVPYGYGTYFFADMQGAFAVNEVAQEKGVCSFLYTVEGYGHPNTDESDRFYRDIYYKIQPRMRAVIEGRTACCEMAATTTPIDTISVDEGQTFDITAIVTGSTNYTSQWCSHPCALDENGTSVTITANDTSFVVYYATDNDNNCAATAYNYIVLGGNIGGIGIDELEDGFEFSVSPNPVTDRLDISNREIRNFTVRVSDMEGKLIAERRVKNGSISLDMTTYTKGIYLVAMEYGDKVQFRKIVRI